MKLINSFLRKYDDVRYNRKVRRLQQSCLIRVRVDGYLNHQSVS